MNATNSPPWPNILVVDDESALRKTIRVVLAANGFAVEEARHGQEALDALRRHPFHLVLLDMNMPGLGGIETCRQIRSFAPCTGIVMLTVRDGEEDKVQALEAGADDYVTKPFRFGELKARMAAVLRRLQPEPGETARILDAGELKIDLDRRSLVKAGAAIRLSRKEFDLLSFLMKHQDVPLTHMQLVRGVWGPESGQELECLRTYVRMLRKKIEDDPAHPRYLLTEPWVGYRFCSQAFDPTSATS
jgi:two-component system KDP operon response regulator KdpE